MKFVFVPLSLVGQFPRVIVEPTPTVHHVILPLSGVITTIFIIKCPFTISFPIQNVPLVFSSFLIILFDPLTFGWAWGGIHWFLILVLCLWNRMVFKVFPTTWVNLLRGDDQAILVLVLLFLFFFRVVRVLFTERLFTCFNYWCYNVHLIVLGDFLDDAVVDFLFVTDWVVDDHWRLGLFTLNILIIYA